MSGQIIVRAVLGGMEEVVHTAIFLSAGALFLFAGFNLDTVGGVYGLEVVAGVDIVDACDELMRQLLNVRPIFVYVEAH
jgi:hypothetical protein